MMHSPQELLKIFEAYRAKRSFDFEPAELYDPIRYILDLGGKRIRPLLTLMGCDLFGGDINEALPAAYAVELFHNFTLVHDDIMDNASLRRNQPTVHQKYSAAQAILSGDVMLIYAYESLNQLKGDKFMRAIGVFNSTAIKVCEGQQYDLNFPSATEVSVKDYMRMIEFKTAELLAGSLVLGAIAGNAGEADARHLYEFGKNIGICFQLLDDLLDAFGDEATFGKKIGGDIAQNKKTYLYIKALELAEGAEREKLIYYFTNNIPVDEKVKHVMETYRNVQVERLAREEAQTYNEAAFRSLDLISVSEDRKKELKDFAGMMFSRKV